MKITEFKEALEEMPDGSDINNLGDWCFKQRNIIRRALLIADKFMQEPSRAMEEIGSGNGTPRHTGWKKPLTPGMRVACTIYDEYERAANCFKDMRDQLIREIEE